MEAGGNYTSRQPRYEIETSCWSRSYLVIYLYKLIILVDKIQDGEGYLRQFRILKI
jgi:hypothetical protein